MSKKTKGNAARGHGGMLVGLEKPKDFKGSFRRLLTYLKPLKLQIYLVIILAILGTAFAVLGPKVMGDAITVLFEGTYEKIIGQADASIDFQKVGKILLLLAALYLFSSVFQFFQTYIMASVAQKTVYDLRKSVFNKMNHLPLSYYDQKSHGDTLSRVTNDIDTIASTLQQTMTQFITSFITILGIIIMMLWISPILTLIAIVSIPLSIFVIKPLIKRSQKHFQAQQNRLGALNGHIEEMYTNHEVITVYNQQAASVHEFNEVNDGLFKASKKAQFISGIIMPLMSFIGNITYVLISIVGGILVTQRAITIGDIQAFITYSKQFSQPITQTANIANIIQSTIAAAERVFELLDEEEEREDSVNKLDKVKGNVSFESVSFGYDELLIKDLNLTVNQGETIAIVGPTGAGKTSLINLLMRFYELNAGRIKIDGTDISTVSRTNLRKQFGMVLQDTWLFNGTIKENIAYGKQDAEMTEIIAASKAARAHSFIQTLPEGYETQLNEEASNISSGQKQLITIARALLSDAPMMILDEATSNVDTRTELQIQHAMMTLMEKRTSFVIAHRLSTIQNADVILVLDQGDIIEKGSHEELLSKEGFYYRLYQSQFSENKVG